MPDNPKYAKSYNPEKIKRETIWWTFGLGLVSLGVVAIVFWLGLALFPLTSWLPGSTGTGPAARPVDWNILGSITSLLTTALIFGGLVFAFFDNIQNGINRKLEHAETSYNIYKDVFDRLMNPEAQAARRWIILNLPTLAEMGGDKAAWLKLVTARLNEVPAGAAGSRPPGLENLKLVLNSFDFIGFVSKHYWSVENELVFWMSPSISKVWERIDLFVEEEARLRNEPDYYESAREFGNYCLIWRRENYPASTIIENGT
jgi:hypothetical protein